MVTVTPTTLISSRTTPLRKLSPCNTTRKPSLSAMVLPAGHDRSSYMSVTFGIIIGRRPSPYSTILNLTCPAMVTRAGHTHSSYCSTIFNTIVLRRPSLYGTTRNPSCSPMAIRADHNWYAQCHMTFTRLYYEDQRCVTPLKLLRAPIW